VLPGTVLADRRRDRVGEAQRPLVGPVGGVPDDGAPAVGGRRVAHPGDGEPERAQQSAAWPARPLRADPLRHGDADRAGRHGTGLQPPGAVVLAGATGRGRLAGQRPVGPDGLDSTVAGSPASAWLPCESGAAAVGTVARKILDGSRCCSDCRQGGQLAERGVVAAGVVAERR